MLTLKKTCVSFFTYYEFLFVPVNFYFPFKLIEVKGHMSEQRAAERVRQSPTKNCCMVRVTNDNSAWEIGISYVRLSISSVRLSMSYVRLSMSYVRLSMSYVRLSISYIRLGISYVRLSISYVRHKTLYFFQLAATRFRNEGQYV